MFKTVLTGDSNKPKYVFMRKKQHMLWQTLSSKLMLVLMPMHSTYLSPFGRNINTMNREILPLLPSLNNN